MAKKRKLPIPTKFQVGDRVRVKQGIRDADYSDMPLGGWAGTILEVHDHGGVTTSRLQVPVEELPGGVRRCSPRIPAEAMALTLEHHQGVRGTAVNIFLKGAPRRPM